MVALWRKGPEAGTDPEPVAENDHRFSINYAVEDRRPFMRERSCFPASRWPKVFFSRLRH